MPFTCSICGEGSTHICARCTKDACDNHLCEKCLRCSDCCECEVTLSKSTAEPARPVVRAAAVVEAELPELEPEPEPRLPEPDPDPVPTPDEPGPVAP